MGLIEIKGMTFYAFHGHFDVEQVVGNQFLVDLELKTDCKKASMSDDLKDALNYQKAYKLVKKVMDTTKSYLLENVCENILNTLHSEFSNLEKAKVRVCKVNPPMGGEIDRVCVSLER